MENERPPFDIVKASFYLVAFVFGAYSVMIFVVLGACAWHAGEILEAHLKCGKEGGILEAMTTLLASALAFAAGRSTK